ncbi:hypothetical protein [Sphingomonas nostoxanthinifaciens]|uniref:hypothetical protein n=1 Tax=Sphingomonas nostoxanthinifaciens TaxID=2872652 RepID=UPI001CC219B2|nr:hypothetical protein [Sphingomonas nostoxanthinifaciens]UAK25920.1 hypothetical protein K8P63_07305 [Sphingomonas nostoxanthinifaciens]
MIFRRLGFVPATPDTVAAAPRGRSAAVRSRLMIAAGLAGFLALPAVAQAAPYPHAQHLADQVAQANPDMLDVLMHVTPPDNAKNVVVAAKLPKDLGEVSGDDDLGVMNTGKPLVEVQKDGVRIGVLVQMRDAKAHAIGALGLMYPYHPGDDQAAVLRRSIKIRDQLAHRIPSRAALFAGA